MVEARLRVDGYLSRTGVQAYDQGPGLPPRREQRDAAEVFAPGALASFRSMPVTVGHPKNEMLDAMNWVELKKGHVGDNVRQAADGEHVAASIWIMDGHTQQAVLDGRLVELSVGYYASSDETPGVNDKGERYDARQVNIRGNHVALLPPGGARGGPTCRVRLDAHGDAYLEASNHDSSPPPAQPAVAPEGAKPAGDRQARRDSMVFKIKVAGQEQEVEIPDDLIAGLAATLAPQVVEAIRAAMKAEGGDEAEVVAEEAAGAEAAPVEGKPVTDAIRAKYDAEKARADALQARLDTELSPEALAARADARARLVAAADRVAGRKLDSSRLSDTALRRAALDAAKVDLAGKTPAYIDARFDAAAELAGSGEHSLVALRVASRGDLVGYTMSQTGLRSVDGTRRALAQGGV